MADTVIVSDDATATSTTALVDQITVAKTFAMLVLGLGSFVLGVVPIKLTKWWRKDPAATAGAGAGHSHGGDSATGSPVVSLLLCFGGGVLLFTTLLHLQPEVREGVTRLQQAGHLPNDQGTEHLGDLIFCAGFFMVFIIDEIVHSVLDRFAAGHADRGSAEEVLHRSMSLRRRTMSIPRASLAGSPSSIPSSDTTGGGTSTASIRELLKESKGKRYRTSAWDAPPPPGAAPEDPRHHQHLHYTHHKRPQSGTAGDAEKQTAKLDRGGGGGQSDDGGGAGQSFRGLFAVLALSFHEVFEGLAIGLEERIDNMWYLFIAVATHKLVIAFCIGLELAWSKTRRIVLVMYVATFAVVTPVGIVIGMVLVQCGSGGSVDGSPGRVAVILQGLAAGTLLYVVFFEVLARHKQSGFLHLLSIMFGFCSLLILQMMTHHHSHAPVDNDHHHHHHSDHDHVHDHSSHDHVHDH